MDVGETHRMGGKRVEVVTVEPDTNGEIVVAVVDGSNRFYSMVAPEALEAEDATITATTRYGNVVIDLPLDGQREARAVWSQAAVDRVMLEAGPPDPPGDIETPTPEGGVDGIPSDGIDQAK